jgi:hypothetical protein
MNKVKIIVLSSIEQINQIINSNNISTEEKVKKIGDGVSATVRVIVSYMKIIDAEKRKAYNLTDKTNIDDELISVDFANRQNGKNAYQTIGVSSDPAGENSGGAVTEPVSNATIATNSINSPIQQSSQSVAETTTKPVSTIKENNSNTCG